MIPPSISFQMMRFVPQMRSMPCRLREREISPGIRWFSSSLPAPPTPAGTRRRIWTPDEDTALRKGIAVYGRKWTRIAAEFVPNRSGQDCNMRWVSVLDPSIKIGLWTIDEDAQLTAHVALRGENWKAVAQQMNGRTVQACKQRWHQNLSPALRKGPWTSEEDAVLLAEYAKTPRAWTRISGQLRRGSVEVKSRYLGLVRRKEKTLMWQPYEDESLRELVAKVSPLVPLRHLLSTSFLPLRSHPTHFMFC